MQRNLQGLFPVRSLVRQSLKSINFSSARAPSHTWSVDENAVADVAVLEVDVNRHVAQLLSALVNDLTGLFNRRC